MLKIDFRQLLFMPPPLEGGTYCFCPVCHNLSFFVSLFLSFFVHTTLTFSLVKSCVSEPRPGLLPGHQKMIVKGSSAMRMRTHWLEALLSLTSAFFWKFPAAFATFWLAPKFDERTRNCYNVVDWLKFIKEMLYSILIGINRSTVFFVTSTMAATVQRSIQRQTPFKLHYYIDMSLKTLVKVRLYDFQSIQIQSLSADFEIWNFCRQSAGEAT